MTRKCGIILLKNNWTASDFTCSLWYTHLCLMFCLYPPAAVQWLFKRALHHKDYRADIVWNRRNRLEELPGRHLDKHLGKRCIFRIRKPSSLWDVTVTRCFWNTHCFSHMFDLIKYIWPTTLKLRVVFITKSNTVHPGEREKSQR